jgi:hypothetical protein
MYIYINTFCLHHDSELICKILPAVKFLLMSHCRSIFYVIYVVCAISQMFPEYNQAVLCQSFKILVCAV